MKKNHPDLHSEVEAFFRVAADRSFSDFQTNTWTSTSKGHGRIETRTCTTLLAEQWLDHVAQGWTKLTTIAQMVSEREIDGKKTSETRYYISSLGNNAKEMAHGIRAHWKIENTLHWCLDVTYGEDACRIRKDNAPANFAIIRRIAHSLVMARKPKNMSVPKVQLNALLNADFMNEYLISD